MESDKITWITNDNGECIAFKNVSVEKVTKILRILDGRDCVICKDCKSQTPVIKAALDDIQNVAEKNKEIPTDYAEGVVFGLMMAHMTINHYFNHYLREEEIDEGIES